MASSSSSSSSQKKYDVFISFRGEDTRLGFTSYLHKALCKRGIETYIDYRLEKGAEVWPALVKAIEDSTLFLIIFSENYASSTWCLDELTKILECTKDRGHLVMPVFYKIDPSHVRKQSGSYQMAFAEFEYNNNKKQVPKWRNALNDAANLVGWHCSQDRNEPELIEEIVDCVIKKVDHMYQGDSQGFVGIQKKIAEVESLLYNGSQDVQFVGIWGMGGIGKTTLAKVVFNKLCFAYEGFCFLENIREESKKYGITHLKRKLISTLLGDKESHVGMADGMAPNALRRLGHKKVLVVLDDVDDQEQLENLAGRHDWFGLDSKILITTRNKQVLGKEVDDIYTIEALNSNDAFHLFTVYAFKSDCLDVELRELAKNVISYVNGIPLALKVLASLLYGKSREEWYSQLEKLKRMPCKKIQHVLKLSYDGLDDEEKNIFLDVACFFKGNNVEYITNLLDGCGHSTIIGLKCLEDKSLLTISEERKVLMHDLIQEMGREIVREESQKDPERRSRLWDANDIFQVLKNNTGTGAIEGITLNVSEIKELEISDPQTLGLMYNLKFLDFHKDIYKPGNMLHFPYGLEFLPNNLRLLRFDEYPSKSLPVTFSADKLVTIQMPYSKLEKLWDGDQNLANLRKVELHQSHYLMELPNFSKAIHLEMVNLSFCRSLLHVHPSILSLHNLNELRLRFCTALTSLTSNTHLKSLTRLMLGGCSELRELSVTSEKKLTLDLEETNINDEWSSSSGCLNKIEDLSLDNCKSLTDLPYKLADLSYLRRLCIDGCNKMATNLHFLFDLSHTLEELSLNNCFDLLELPEDIKHLSRLKWLSLDGCNKLRSIPELPPSLLYLSAQDCISLDTLQLTYSNAVILGEQDDQVFFNIQNCIKLDQQLIKAVETKAVFEMNKFVSAIENGSISGLKRAELVYPGSKVPEWFTYRTTQSSITFNLPSFPHSQDWSFIFCVIVSPSKLDAWFDITYHLRINGQWVKTAVSNFFGDIVSDHVCIQYASNLPSLVQRKIEEIERDGQSSTYNLMVEIKFEVDAFTNDEDMVIRGVGVCPTYALEYRNYVKQIGMEVGCSYDNTEKNRSGPRKRKISQLLELENR